MVEQITHDAKVKGLTSSSAGFSRESIKIIKLVFDRQRWSHSDSMHYSMIESLILPTLVPGWVGGERIINSSSTVVEQLTHNPKVKGLNPASVDNGIRNYQ